MKYFDVIDELIKSFEKYSGGVSPFAILCDPESFTLLWEEIRTEKQRRWMGNAEPKELLIHGIRVFKSKSAPRLTLYVLNRNDFKTILSQMGKI